MAFLYNDEFMQNHYCNIFRKNQEKLAAGGTGDPYLTGKLPDTRMALTLVLRISPEVTANVSHMLAELAQEAALHAALPGKSSKVPSAAHPNPVKSCNAEGYSNPALYLYPADDFHITVMDILGGREGRQLPDNLKDYMDTIRICAEQIEPFRIHFKGTTSSDSALLVQGFYEEGLQQFRQALREAFHEKELPLEERYETFSCHITAARVISRITDPALYRRFVDSHAETDFGTMTVNDAELVFHNWYDSVKTSRVFFSFRKPEI